MAYYAIVTEGVVDNVIVAEPEVIEEMGEKRLGGVAIDITNTEPRPAIGDLWDGVTFTKAPVPPSDEPSDG